MKQYRITSPKKDNYCVPSCLQAVFRKYDLEISQENIADILIKKKKGFIPEGEKLENFLKQRGLNYKFYWYNETPFNEPDALIQEGLLHNMIIGINDHCFILSGFEKDKISLLDPNNSLINEKDYYEITRNMFHSELGFFGLIKKVDTLE
jgi:ABC-type bacteriocin/lantibiotic exporter with double-glycine peptidase domain